MVNYDDIEDNLTSSVTVTEFRRHMAQYIATVRYGDDYVCIKRKNADPVYLVCKADFDLIWEKSDDLRGGPRNEKGHRTGLGFLYWLREIWKAEQTGDPEEVRRVNDVIDRTTSVFGTASRPEARSNSRR